VDENCLPCYHCVK